MKGVRAGDTGKKGVQDKNIGNSKRKYKIWKQYISKSTLIKDTVETIATIAKKHKICLILHQQTAKNRIKKKVSFSSSSSWVQGCWRMDSAFY